MPPIVSGTKTGSFLLYLILKADLAIYWFCSHWLLNKETRETKIFKIIAYLQLLRRSIFGSKVKILNVTTPKPQRMQGGRNPHLFCLPNRLMQNSTLSPWQRDAEHLGPKVQGRE